MKITRKSVKNVFTETGFYIKDTAFKVGRWFKRQWRKIVGVAIIATAIAAGGLLEQDLTNEVSKDKLIQKFEASTNIKEKYGLDGAKLKLPPKNENSVAIELGEKDNEDFIPNLKISRWENEVWFKIKPNLTAIATKDKDLFFENEKIKFVTPKVDYQFYDKPDASDEGGYEFEIILKEKPASNVVSLDIETSGLTFDYQGELTQQQKDDGTTRPDNVIGSYAVSHATKKGNVIGQKEYKTGKVGHLFRPKVIDANGNWVWGEFNKDLRISNKLEITISQDFLDGAVYPIVIDPTFGYTQVGVSSCSKGVDNLFVNGDYTSPSDVDTVTGLSIHMVSTNNVNYRIKGIIADSFLAIASNGIGDTTSSDPGLLDDWVTSDYSSSTVTYISPELIYYFGAVFEDLTYFDCDDIFAYSYFVDSTNSFLLPTGMATSSSVAGTAIASSYLTYTSTGTYPYWVSSGAQSVSSSDGATSSPALPSNWQADDLLLLVIAGRPRLDTGGTNSVSAGWTKQGDTVRGTASTSLEIWYRVAQAGDTNPIITPHADYTSTGAGATAGFSSFVSAYRNVDTTTPFDVVNATSTTAAALLATAPSITTATNYALAVSIVETADDNALELNVAEGFNSHACCTDYDDILGDDRAMALADFTQGIAGAVIMPEWRENINGNDAWVGITAALRPTSGAAPPAYVSPEKSNINLWDTKLRINNNQLRIW